MHLICVLCTVGENTPVSCGAILFGVRIWILTFIYVCVRLSGLGLNTAI